MKDLLEPMLKQLPTFLPDLGKLIVGPKTAIVQWVAEEKGELKRPFIFVAVAVAFGFLLQLPQLGKDQNAATLVAGMAVFKVLALALFALIIHLLFRMVRGRATFVQTFSAYLYVVSPLYIVLVVLEVATQGVLRAYNPETAAVAQLDPAIMYADAARWRVFQEAAPKLALAYTMLNAIKVILLFGWSIACWGAFRRLHEVSRWRSVVAGVAAFIAAIFFFQGLDYILLGMFNTRVPALR